VSSRPTGKRCRLAPGPAGSDLKDRRGVTALEFRAIINWLSPIDVRANLQNRSLRLASLKRQFRFGFGTMTGKSTEMMPRQGPEGQVGTNFTQNREKCRNGARYVGMGGTFK